MTWLRLYHSPAGARLQLFRRRDFKNNGKKRAGAKSGLKRRFE
jgi:hypothetical protein